MPPSTAITSPSQAAGSVSVYLRIIKEGICRSNTQSVIWELNKTSLAGKNNSYGKN